jgi:SAM-dependent methyltransferase/predicted metal-dependent enzyme (double-stranded beta helix superfamily)
MTLDSLIKLARETCPQDFNYDWLGAFVREINVGELEWRCDLPTIENPSDYARNIRMLDPFEIVLLHWPPGVESAVHLHAGFWGYVLCLEGSIENIAYSFENGQLSVDSVVRGFPGGVLPEPDGTIHKIRNASSSEPLVTLHFYAPALDTLDGLQLFDLESGDIKTCNAQAPTASLELEEGNYKRIVRNAFSFVIPEAGSTHELVPILPKPSPSEINRLISLYYNEQAEIYDAQDRLHNTRKAYTEGIDRLIVQGINRLAEQQKVEKVLHVACGTGRRARGIQEATGLGYEVHGMDMSDEMVQIARNRGLQVVHGQILDVEPPAAGGYDVIAFLYAYGHLSSREQRRTMLERMHKWLKPGGLLIFDVFDINDPHEWGGKSLELFETFQLGTQGYERGDLFYRRKGGEGLAFLHYSSAPVLIDLLEDIGFELDRLERVGYNVAPGELVDEGGNVFLQVRKIH